MDDYNYIIGLAIFTLYTFIFSLFMLPLIKNLKTTQYKLKGLIKPKMIFEKHKDKGETKEELTKTLNNIIKEYRLDYLELHKFKNILILGGCITILFIIALFIVSNWANLTLFFSLVKNHTIHRGNINWSNIIKTIYTIIIILLIIYVLDEYIPSTGKITEWSHMMKYFGFSPGGIAECANIYVDYNYKDESKNTTNIRPIRIYSDIEIRGYKYWFFAYDIKTGECVYSIIGKIKENTSLFSAFFDIGDYEARYTTIGELNTHKLGDKELKMVFFVFDPCIKDKKGCPYRGFNDFNPKENCSFNTNYAVHLQNYIYSKIIYEGEDLKFKNIYWNNENGKMADENMEQSIEHIFNQYKSHLI